MSYVLFTTRSEASSPIRWLIAGIIYALGTPLLIGFLLPLTSLIFVDVLEGLRSGLWISAFVETLLGSFLDGYIYMVKVRQFRRNGRRVVPHNRRSELTLPPCGMGSPNPRLVRSNLPSRTT